MNLYETFGTDKTLESKDGVKLNFGEGVYITVLRSGGSNKKFAALLAEKVEPFRFQIDKGTLDAEVQDKILAEIYAESILIGWGGINDKNGVTLQFTFENAVKLLLDLPELFAVIKKEAAEFANFTAAKNEENAKN